MYQEFVSKICERKYIKIIISVVMSIKRQICQFYTLACAKPSVRPTVLLCAVYIMKNGGIEKRLKQYSSVWEKKGYRVLWGAQMGNGAVDIFLTSCRLYNKYLLRIVSRVYGVNCIEFNVGGPPYSPPLDIKALNKYNIPVGIILHASAPNWKFDYLQDAAYVICSHKAHGKRVPELEKFPVLPNAVITRSACWKWREQKEALLVSRICYDKRSSIEGFICLCQAWGIPFRIAGDLTDTENIKLKHELLSKFNLHKEIFLGKINTEEFLQRSWDRFLFVAGVGQVILEAGQLNYPCLVASLLGKSTSFWVTKENIYRVLDYNCSPHDEAECKLLKEGQNLNECLRDILAGNTGRFAIGDVINKECCLDTCLARYEKIITPH